MFRTDFACGAEEFASPAEPVIRGHFEYIPDPYGTGRGAIFAATITDSGPQSDDQRIRLYPSIDFRDQPLLPPYMVELDVNISGLEGAEIDALNEWNRGFAISLLDLFSTAETAKPGFPRPWMAAVQVNLEKFGRSLYPVVTYIDTNGDGHGGIIYPGSLPLIQGMWSRLALEILPDHLALYKDGVLVSATEGTVSAVWMHPGLYLWPWGPSRKLVRDVRLLQDNLSVRK